MSEGQSSDQTTKTLYIILYTYISDGIDLYKHSTW